jgi:hypothetical protein
MKSTPLQKAANVREDISKFTLRTVSGKGCFCFSIKFNMKKWMKMKFFFAVAINMKYMMKGLSLE